MNSILNLHCNNDACISNSIMNYVTNNDEKRFNDIGKKILQKNDNKMKQALEKYTNVQGEIDFSKISDDWFPSDINADIFLSHSHKDENLAITLAGWLYEKFHLTTFIDSCLWGYSNDLLKQIDESYCKNKNSDTYDYTKRNISTSHVHMMLGNALIKMIDQTECFIFLETENSIVKTIDEINAVDTNNSNKTYSPWIYLEINVANTIQQKNPKRYETKLFFESTDIIGTYKLQFENFKNINNENFKNWYNEYNKEMTHYALDILYKVMDNKNN